MILRFPATLDIKDYKDHNITKSDDLLCVRYDSAYRDKVRAELRKINEKNAKNMADGKEPVELDITVDIHYKKRSLDQNAWLWRAHEIEANIVNGTKSAWTDSQKIRWRTAESITPEMIHSDYMEQYARRGYIEVEPGFVDEVRKMVNESMGRVMKEQWLPDKQKMQFEIWRTSSYMDVREFCELADHVVENLLAYGVDLNNAVDYEALSVDLREIKNGADTTKQENPSMGECLQAQNVGTSSQSADNSEQVALTNPVDSVSLVTEVFHGKVVDKQLDIF